MSSTPRPTFRTLSKEECEALLGRLRVGRLAYVAQDRVDIEPIHYAYVDGWILARTGPGTKLATITRNPWVALEADEVDGDFDWRSVVAKGTVYFVPRDDTPRGIEVRESVISAFRRVVAEAFSPADPTPERTVLFRIHVDELHGRAASTAPGDADRNI